jgi:hypothetical protein
LYVVEFSMLYESSLPEKSNQDGRRRSLFNLPFHAFFYHKIKGPDQMMQHLV